MMCKRLVICNGVVAACWGYARLFLKDVGNNHHPELQLTRIMTYPSRYSTRQATVPVISSAVLYLFTKILDVVFITVSLNID